MPLSPLITWEIGEKTLAHLERFEVIFRSPSIPYRSPEIQQAARSGVEIYSQTKLFFDLCPAPIIAVTGTKGKGTTSTLIYELLRSRYTVHLGGNMGVDPFSFLPKLSKEDLVILELSSFQTQDLQKSPHVAVMLNITPDHLNHHHDFAEYYAAKAQLLAHQTADDLAILNADYPLVEQLASATNAKVYRYSKEVPRRQSAWADRETVFVEIDTLVDSFSVAGRQLLGRHNLENILPAVLVATLYGVPMPEIRKSVIEFPGLPHRIFPVGRLGEVDFYDDSIATNPEASLAAIRAFSGRRIHLIVGGSDKGADYADFAREVRETCVTVSLLPGDAGKKLLKALHHAKGDCLILDKAQAPLFPTVLSGIQPHIQKGDVVLLSPAAASFASFKDYKERGDLFAQAVV